MDKDQIKKIARDYAEEYYKVRGGTELMADEAENVIRFVLRRHCLVEKSTVQEEWEGLENQGEMCLEMNAMAGVLAVGSQMSMLQRLFGPQLGKEVE